MAIRQQRSELRGYSLMYLLRTCSICFCWKRPLMISWLLPSIEPLRKKNHEDHKLCTMADKFSTKRSQNWISIRQKFLPCPKLRHEEGENVLWLSVQAVGQSSYDKELKTPRHEERWGFWGMVDLRFANFWKIGEWGFLGTSSHDLWWLHDETLFLSSNQLWILVPHDVKDTLQ